jgi:hypothetical protein
MMQFGQYKSRAKIDEIRKRRRGTQRQLLSMVN